jgi:4'-phosphopantetheinyl transferase EntD
LCILEPPLPRTQRRNLRAKAFSPLSCQSQAISALSAELRSFFWWIQSNRFFSVEFALAQPEDVDVILSWQEQSHLKQTLKSLAHEKQRLLGRAALKKLQTQIRQPLTLELSLPHPFYSMSHAGKDWALAITCLQDPPLSGLGVDLEIERPLPEGALQHFTTAAEQNLLAEAFKGSSSSSPESVVLRAWSIKEALFKADLQNQGHVIESYRLRTLQTAQLPESEWDLGWGEAQFENSNDVWLYWNGYQGAKRKTPSGEKGYTVSVALKAPKSHFEATEAQKKQPSH